MGFDFSVSLQTSKGKTGATANIENPFMLTAAGLAQSVEHGA